MNNNLTEIVAILDKSGSMENLTNATVDGYNGFIEEQKELPGEAILTTILFSDTFTRLHDRLNIQRVAPVTVKDYKAGGSTALLDTLGKTISDIGLKLYNTPEPERPGKVIFFIITDGEENASKKYTHEETEKMVELQRTIYSWDFIFMGANMNSVEVGKSIGILSHDSIDFEANDIGVRRAHMSMSRIVKSRRMSNT